jgi:hypothetical protein
MKQGVVNSLPRLDISIESIYYEVIMLIIDLIE